MQKKITWVLVLMSFCVLGITGLQLYWNYQNYQTTVTNFKKDSNDALTKAVDDEIGLRHQLIKSAVRKWLSDTAFITITCDINNRDSNTVFHMRDTHPYFKDAKPVSIGIANFKEKVRQITPEAKNIFINHFTDNTLGGDLRKGIIYFYTQRLGDSLSRIYNSTKANTNSLATLFKKELTKKGIYTPFKLNVKKNDQKIFVTPKVNTALRRPYEKEMVWASLENPNAYYFREMRWLIISSLLLIGITVFCFYYTVKTLLNQSKLVAMKNQFISNMTHEIHTPLSSIQITAEAMQQFDQDVATRNKYLDIILYQTKKLTHLTKEILGNAKLEHIAFPTNETIKLRHLVTEVIDSVPLPTGTHIQFEASPDLVIKGNQLHLFRALSNVVENAIKYNTATNPLITIYYLVKNKEVNIYIADNGPGIADEFKGKIFDQFFRVPTGNVHDIKGYGLGLSYVQKVIMQHRGQIKVSDNRPNGSIFIIQLPI
ncbi:HAMP domain-containing sensor histidine kinase [Pedobacter sp. KR3-3]|uniref:histidine kinase n=1 Tax=Pedobacter albus TaxID=3113905 RepID=A0ABU7I4D6_9SPHI|nr:HAMP domain-containing sensor histidine kinase [Pedobacter sp. KR3-3]MEE1944323.1 HAMP domain-containing sensor histidine kinase [Pedobacter sp. KR3-3]